MKRTGLICLGAVWLGLLGFAGFKARAVARQQAEREALTIRRQQLENELAALRRERAGSAAELAQAERQLAALAPTKAIKPEHQAEIDRWLGRVRRLRQMFAEHPAQRIPEMQFLTEQDWLREAKTHAMDTDDALRAAASALRHAGMGKFAERISAALRKYSAANKSERPLSVQILAAYFDGPVDPMLLERYAIIDRPAFAGQTWAVANKSPVDPDYDVRYQLMPTGGMMMNAGTLAWNPDLMERYRAASTKYRRANPGQVPQGVDLLLPYFDPPLEREWVDRLKKGENRR